jgi:hypothetical protein
MSLNVWYDGIEDWEYVVRTQKPLLDAVSLAFMSVDMDGLRDEDDVDEFMWRARVLHATDGARLLAAGKGGEPPRDFTREELLPYVGIRCNVSRLTSHQFLGKVRRLHMQEMKLDKQKRAKGEPTTLEERMQREQRSDPLRPIRLRVLDPNFTSVEIGELDMFFSYETLVAVRSKHGWLVSENVWSNTTGKQMTKHLPNHERTKHDVWEQLVAVVLEEHGLLP